MARTWTLALESRPWTVNAARNWHYQKLAKEVKAWRKAYEILALENRVPKLNAVCIEVIPILADRRTQDTAACCLAAKAAIDGIVDAGVIPDDRREFLKSIKFFPPVVERGRNALLITIIEVLKNEEENHHWGTDSQ